jgi:hypothetical protein
VTAPGAKLFFTISTQATPTSTAAGYLVLVEPGP